MLLTDVREFLTERRARIGAEHARGAGGRAVAAALTDAVDEGLRRLYTDGLAARAEKDRAVLAAELAVVAVAGYGRRDLAPFSDVDLLLLLQRRASNETTEFAKELTRAIWDVGLALGQNVADGLEMLRLAREEVIPLTGLLEARFLFGNQRLQRSLAARLERDLDRGGAARLFTKAVDEVAKEQAEFGSSSHLLEPDVKRSAGGLRDIHLLRWIARSTYKTTDFEELERRGVLGAGDARAILEAHDFLLRVRNELHFHAGRAIDSLGRGEQMRIAKRWGFEDSGSLLAVEQFMRRYYQHTTAVVDVLGRFLEQCRPRSGWTAARDYLFSRRAAAGLLVQAGRLVVAAEIRQTWVANLEKTLELAEIAAGNGVDLDRETIERLRQTYLLDAADGEGSVHAADRLFDDRPLPREVARRFLSLLSQPGRLGPTLRMLHQVGVLGQVLPAFEHARCLLQFNAYHKYTVDEHTFVMIETVERFADDKDLLGRAYGRIERKDLLHLAILLHDLGKGLPEDHSEIGRRIAESVARRLGLADEDRRLVVFLVHQHLAMSHMAYRRDTSDPKLQIELVRAVGTMGVLRMLFVLTAADTIAVGPGTFTKWKRDLLFDLYLRAGRLLGEEELASGLEDRIEGIREKLLSEHGTDERSRAFLEQLPMVYLAETSNETLVAQLLQWRALDATQVATLTEFLPESKTVAYTIITNERICEGIFHKICGALSAHFLEILSARIHTLPDGTVIDRFEVIDTHHAGQPTPERSRKVGTTIRRVLTGELLVDDILWGTRSSLFAPKKPLTPRAPTRVEIDNASSDQSTVIDVFTQNRRGLLYTLTKAFFRLGLSVQYAKIATYEDEVVDVFYVVEADGRKVQAEDRIALIQNHIASDLHRLAVDPRAMGF